MHVDPKDHPQYDLVMSISAAVLAAERDMDTSILTLSRLVTTTIEDFTAAALPPAMSQRALDKLAAALATHVDTRRQLGEAHREYGRTAKLLGASEDEWGPVWPCPPPGKARPARRQLKLAA